MSTLTRIFGRVREQFAELSESITGNPAQRDIDEEIRGTDARLHEWRASLAAFQANRITAQERIDASVAAIAQREAQALGALQAGKTSLAREVAAAIVQLEQVRDDEQAFVHQLEERIAQMRQLIEQGENGLRRLQHQLDALRAAETVQRAQETVAGRQPGTTSLPQTAIASLLRSRRHAAAPAETGRDREAIADPALDARLEAAGIDERDARTQLVLDRIAQRLPDTTHPAGRRGKAAPRSTR